jgi:hypothetical protein
LTALQRLDLSENQLTALPPEIGQLTALQRLDLSENQLTAALPPEIGRLKALQSLNLERNQLTALPPEIGRLTALQGLNLFENQLTALPPEIGQLTALRIFWLESSRRALLITLPPEIGQWLDGLERSTSEGALLFAPADAVGFGVSYPPRVPVNIPFVVDAWVFLQEQRDAVARQAMQLDGVFKSSGSAALALGSMITVRLNIHSWTVQPPSQELLWSGSPVKRFLRGFSQRPCFGWKGHWHLYLSCPRPAGWPSYI